MGKYTDLWNKKKESALESEDIGFSSGGLPKLKWFYPNKAVKATESGKYYVRVLPIESASTWYFEFKKHSIKIGTWKNCLCINETSTKCPVCDFLVFNEDKLEGNTNVKSLIAKDHYAILVYDYVTKECLRLELNHYGFMDVLGAIIANEDENFEANIDKEGFNLYYDKDENGWAKIAGVKQGKKLISDIKEELQISSFPNIKDYTVPINLNGISKVLTGIVNLAINANLFPEVEAGTVVAKKKIINDEDNSSFTQKKAKKEVEPEDSEDFEELEESNIKIDLSEEIEEEVEQTVKKGSKNKEPAKTKESKSTKSEVKKTTTVINDDELDDLLKELDI